jgi:hypothetical protein
VKLKRKICSPRNKLMERYTQTVWVLILNLLSFNITHVKRELNSMVDRLAIFAASPNQKKFPHMPDCYFQSIYCPHILDNVESWQALPRNERICSFIQDGPLKPEEIISIENNKILEGLTPLKGLFFIECCSQ